MPPALQLRAGPARSGLWGPCPAEFCIRGWGFDDLAGHLVQWLTAFSWSFFSSFLIRISHVAADVWCLSLSHLTKSLAPSSLYPAFRKLQTASMFPCSWARLLLSAAPGPSPPVAGLAGRGAGDRKLKQVPAQGCPAQGMVAPLALLLQPRMQAAASAAGTCCCLVAGFFSAEAQTSFSTKLVSVQLQPFLLHSAVASQVLGLCLLLLTLRGPCQPVCLPSAVAIPAPQRAPSLLRFFFPLSLVKTLNSAGPGVDPWGMLLVTSHCWALHCWSQRFQHSGL